MATTQTERKKEALLDSLKKFEKAAVAFSGGVDSSFLAYVAREALGEDAVALTVVSPLLSGEEYEDALSLARTIGIRHVLVEMDELQDPLFAANPADKCYICKKERFSAMEKWARERDIQWLLDGSNADDLADYRPGMKALAENPFVRSPLLEAGLAKAEIRQLSRDLGLFTWNKPARACLASRIPYGETITREKLQKIEQAETFLASFLPPKSQFRVRVHDDVARIEADMKELLPLLSPDMTGRIHDELTRMGFRYVTLDLKGYRMGSLNEALSSDTEKGK